MSRERLGVAESVNALKDRKIDAFFWVGGLPTAAVTDLANTPGRQDQDDRPRRPGAGDEQEVRQPVRQGRDLRRTSTRAWTSDNQQATVMNILVAHEKMDDKTAYNIVKTIFDKRDELIRVHKEAENFKLENQKKEASPLPWHPGRGQVLRRERRQAQLGLAGTDRAPTSMLAGLFSLEGGAMSEEVARLHQPAAEVSEEALRRAEEMIEQEEGVQNRFAGWRAALVATIAVAMSVFHLYTAYDIVRPEHLRATHVAFVLVLTFLVFPVARRFRHRIMLVGLAARGGRHRHGRVPHRGRRRVLRPLDPARDLGHRLRRRPDAARARGDAPHHRLDHADRHRLLPALCALRQLPAAAVDAPGLRGAAADRPHVHDAGRHLRHRGRGLLHADHPVHDLRRLPAVSRAPASSSSISPSR